MPREDESKLKRKHKRSDHEDEDRSSALSKSAKKKKKLNKIEHRKKSSKRSYSSADSSSVSDSSSQKKRKRKHKHKKKKSKHKKMDERSEHSHSKKSKHKKEDSAELPVGPVIATMTSTANAPSSGVAKGPMTKEMWEKQQSVVRRVFDTDTGRSRLVKGSGEIIEEIVSKEQQKQINKLATQGDGISYGLQTGTLR